MTFAKSAKKGGKLLGLEGIPTLQIREIRKNKIGFQKTPTTFATSVKKGGKLLIGCLAWRESPHFTPPTARSPVSCLPLQFFCLLSASAAILTFCPVICLSRCDHHQE